MKKQDMKEMQEMELAKIAAIIEDDIDNLDLIEREAQHMSEMLKADREMVKRRISAMRHIEKMERKKAQRSKQRLLMSILVFICGIDPLRAMALCALMDEQSQPGGCGIGVVL